MWFYISAVGVGLLLAVASIAYPLPAPHQIVVIQPCQVYSQTSAVTVIGTEKK